MIGIQISVVRKHHIHQIIRYYSANIAFHIPLACQFVRAGWRYLASNRHACVRFNLVCIPKSIFIPVYVITIFGYRFSLLYYLLAIDLPSIIQMDGHKYMYICLNAMFKIISLLLHQVRFVLRIIRDN